MVNAATSLYLSYAPPYDWDAMLAFLGARAIPGVEVVSRQSYTRTIAIGDARGVLSVEPAADQRVHLSVRSEEHTSELQSRVDVVCRLLLEKKKDVVLEGSVS